MQSSEKIARIEELKRSKGVTILSHYYTQDDVQRVADFLGDSLALSIAAQSVESDTILFAGVNFMAQTAKVLSPQKRVLLPCMDAGCSLADSCSAEGLAQLKAQYPDHLVVSYVNTSVEVKALTDVCCTSSNALDVVNSIPLTRSIIFTPDRNLGSYIKRITGRENMVIWDGACHVHEEFSLEAIVELKRSNPEAHIVAHPECRAYILEVADFVGSTSAIIDYCAQDGVDEFIVVTESGILFELKRLYPGKRFIPAPPLDSTCGCNECKYMKMISLDDIINTLENFTPEITIDEDIRKKAEGSIIRMINPKERNF
ncbi:MAG: quinolinate synthase NadA [Rikenellaceae bacterium]